MGFRLRFALQPKRQSRVELSVADVDQRISSPNLQLWEPVQATRRLQDWFPRKHNHSCGCEHGSERRTLWHSPPRLRGHFRATFGPTQSYSWDNPESFPGQPGSLSRSPGGFSRSPGATLWTPWQHARVTRSYSRNSLELSRVLPKAILEPTKEGTEATESDPAQPLRMLLLASAPTCCLS